MDFKALLHARQEEAEEVVRQFLPRTGDLPGRAAEAVNYSMMAGGKRLRPVLLASAFRLCGGQGEMAEPFMAAIEMIHTHSLIHDDLPAIDNDDFRRGQRTTHKVYGEALGILAGDVLLNYAYETALQAFDRAGDPERIIRALRILAEKAGIRGMLGGQCVDVENEKNERTELPKEEVDYIYLHKTSALLEASLMAGAALAGADAETVGVFEQIGRKTGLAFQIRDDILDVTADEAELGKPVGSDERNGKTTYVTLFGVDGASDEAELLTDEALSLLAGLSVPEDAGEEREFLTELLRRLAVRTY